MRIVHVYLLALLLLTALPTSVAFASGPQTYQELAKMVVSLLSAATVTAVIFGIVIYFWYMAWNIPNFGEANPEKLRLFFFWGIIIITVMVSFFGIVRLLQDTVFSGQAGFNGGGGRNAPCNRGPC